MTFHSYLLLVLDKLSSNILKLVCWKTNDLVPHLKSLFCCLITMLSCDVADNEIIISDEPNLQFKPQLMLSNSINEFHVLYFSGEFSRNIKCAISIFNEFHTSLADLIKLNFA